MDGKTERSRVNFLQGFNVVGLVARNAQFQRSGSHAPGPICGFILLLGKIVLLGDLSTWRYLHFEGNPRGKADLANENVPEVK